MKARFTAEQIIGLLKQQEGGVSVAQLCREHNVSAASFYKWKAKYGGLRVDEAKRLKQLEEENGKLKRIVADDEVKAWLTANLHMEWYSAKRLRRIVHAVCAQLEGVQGQLALIRYRLIESLSTFIQQQTDIQTEKLFDRLHEEGNIVFFLECVECNYEIPRQIERRRLKTLVHDDNSPIQKSLFDYSPDEDNSYERDVALALDNNSDVLWWYRNLVGAREFNLQGYRRHRIYPDYVVQQTDDDRPRPTVLVVESKGTHMRGSVDTDYKRTVAKYFQDIGKIVTWQEVTWKELGQGFDKHCFRFQILDQGDSKNSEWRQSLDSMLASGEF